MMANSIIAWCSCDMFFFGQPLLSFHSGSGTGFIESSCIWGKNCRWENCCSNGESAGEETNLRTYKSSHASQTLPGLYTPDLWQPGDSWAWSIRHPWGSFHLRLFCQRQKGEILSQTTSLEVNPRSPKSFYHIPNMWKRLRRKALKDRGPSNSGQTWNKVAYPNSGLEKFSSQN